MVAVSGVDAVYAVDAVGAVEEPTGTVGAEDAKVEEKVSGCAVGDTKIAPSNTFRFCCCLV